MDWLTIWNVLLSGAVLATVLLSIFIFTLPTSYTHFLPDTLKETAFSDTDKNNAKQSGYNYYLRHRDATGRLQTKTSVQVVVLGDIGRSPRMQYHALSLAACGATVQLLGYVETEPHPDILASRFITILPFDPLPSGLQSKSKALFLLTAPLKVSHQIASIYKALAYQSRPSKYMLVQNPPSIPLLAIASFVCFFRNTRLVIDWHNFGYTILALKLGQKHPLVLISKVYEHFMARAADAHFAVTDAMRRVLRIDFGIAAVTLHDRPAEQFRPITSDERYKFLTTCPNTKLFAGEIERGRRRLLVSPTSWTADEDFELLLTAMSQYSSLVSSQRALPELLVIITGKGPLKDHFARRIKALEEAGAIAHVKICQAWLSIDDYALLLAAADLGVSLHTSSSGVDLPMKVLDMFGAGLPAAGWSRYEAWPELVQEGVNGVGFGSAEELSEVLVSLFSNNAKRLDVLRQGARGEGERRWHNEWMRVAADVFHLR